MSVMHIPEGEWKLLRVLWDQSPRTITQLTQALRAESGWTKGTVISILNRLQARGAVYYEEGERARLYYPAVAERDLAAAETEGFVRRVWRGDLGLMMSAMVSGAALREDDLNRLDDMLRQARQELARSAPRDAAADAAQEE